MHRIDGGDDDDDDGAVVGGGVLAQSTLYTFFRICYSAHSHTHTRPHTMNRCDESRALMCVPFGTGYAGGKSDIITRTQKRPFDI